MLTNLENVVKSLLTVIFEYHDIQCPHDRLFTKDVEENRQLIQHFMEKTPDDFSAQVGQYIDECTKKYNDRSPLLYFLLHKASQIHGIIHEQKPFDKTELEVFIKDIYKLSNTSKSSNCKVSQNGSEIDIKGMQAKHYGHCRSFELLRDYLLVHLFDEDKAAPKDAQIVRVCRELADNYNNKRLIAQKLPVLEASVLKQKSSIAALEEEVARLKAENMELSKQKLPAVKLYTGNYHSPFFQQMLDANIKAAQVTPANSAEEVTPQAQEEHESDLKSASEPANQSSGMSLNDYLSWI